MRDATRASAGTPQDVRARNAARIAAAAAPDAWRMSHLRPHSVNMGGMNPLSMN